MPDSISKYEEWHKAMALAEAGVTDRLYPWHQTVLKLLPDLAGKKVLEVGCGRGDFARLLGQKYPTSEIVAVDFSATAIDHAKSNSSSVQNVRFEVADAQKLPFEGAGFDFLISCECLEHLENPARALSSMAACLRAGGGFIITTENYFNGLLLAWFNSWLRGKPFNSGSGVQPRENFFLYWKVLRVIANAGLQITHMESNHFVWLLLPGFAPATFTTFDFQHTFLRRLFRPFGRHFTFKGLKP